eukprot:10025204-Heterocapsa_arctica.AAC.1
MSDQPRPNAVLWLDRESVLRLELGLQGPDLALDQLLHDAHRAKARRAVAGRVTHDRLPRQSLQRNEVGELLDRGLAISLHDDGRVGEALQVLLDDVRGVLVRRFRQQDYAEWSLRVQVVDRQDGRPGLRLLDDSELRVEEH